jgi:hypothetical protein
MTRSRFRLWAVSAIACVGCRAVSGDPSSIESTTFGGDVGTGSSSDAKGREAGSTSSPQAAGRQPGGVQLLLVDAPAEVGSVFVTVSHVDADLADGGWRTLVEGEKKVDLLTLRGGAALDLGSASLPAGRVNQLRLHLAEGAEPYLTTLDGVEHPLAVPSGTEAGIKLVGGFDVPECATGQVTLDFDVEQSLESHAKGWMLRPVVRIKALALESDCGDAGASADADSGTDAGAS